MWNQVNIDEAIYVVDVMFDPGALYPSPSAKATQYCKMLGELEPARYGGEPRTQVPLPPSYFKDVDGKMLRPPWHVEPWELNFERRDRIGKGGFGEVYHGSWAGTRVAIKEIRDSSPTDAEVVDFILEIALLSQLNHPNIVRLWRGSTQISDRNGSRSLLMVTEYVRTGSLSQLLHGHGGPALPEPLTLEQALSMGMDIARGVQYLHGHKILHLDLKSPNVLCAPVWTAKLCDFGLAKIRGEHTLVHSTLQGVSPVWAPPEMLDDLTGGLTEKADVYSFAIVFLELLSQKVPFREFHAAQLAPAKLQGHLPKIPDGVPADCSELIFQCCAAKPNTRPPISGAVARLREMARARNFNLAEVEPPTALMQSDWSHHSCEEYAVKRLAELDEHRKQSAEELSELKRRIFEVRQEVEQLEAEMPCPEGQDSGGVKPSAPAEVGAGDKEVVASDEEDNSWCEPYVQELTGSKFKCILCSKMFRSAKFVRRHVASKHCAQVQTIIQDKYFDFDISKEDALPAHKSLPPREKEAAGRMPPTAVLDNKYCQLIQEASEHGDVAQVETLLSLRTDPQQQDDAGMSPLCLAARNGHKEVARVLLTSAPAQSLLQHCTGAGVTAVHIAAQEGHSDALALLISQSAEVNGGCIQGKTPLLYAGENGHMSACRLLVEARADFKRRTKDEETLLHTASRYGEATLVSQVVAWRADLSAVDREGWTSLHEAARWGIAAVQALCLAQAQVDVRSQDDETPVHVAAKGYEPMKACGALLERRADVLARNVGGQTPLHVATRHGNFEACQILLTARAEPNAVDHSGRTPSEVATRHGPLSTFLRLSGSMEIAEPGV